MHTPSTPQSGRSLLRSAAAALPAFALAAAVTGCSTGALTSNFGVGGSSGGSAVHFTGNVHGGQQPVVGADITLYTVGTTGIASASTPINTAAVTTDANGDFNITGKYACTSATEVYIVASGGNPGGGVNSALRMVAALGSCTQLQANAASTFITINELSTVAAAYALAPFAADLTHIGASGSNPTGLLNAFSTVNELYNLGAGTAGGSTLATGAIVPTAELNTLGNMLAACINTTGAASTQCSTLFSATGATETFGAALAIAKNPGAPAITALYSLSAPTSPFQPTLASQPKDFSVAVSYAGAGNLSSPYGLAIDAAGNAWVTNASGNNVSLFSPVGAPLANATPAGLAGPQAVAIDSNGIIYVANTAGNSLITLSRSGNTITPVATCTANIQGPVAVAIDHSNNVFVANFNGNSVAAFSSPTCTPLGSGVFTAGGAITAPTAIATDATGDVFVTSSNGTVVELNPASAGANALSLLATLTDNALQGPTALAVDHAGDVFAGGFNTGSSIVGAVSMFSPAGTPSSVSPTNPGLTAPGGIAVDNSSAWVTNNTSTGGLAQLKYGVATASSPAGGFGSLNTPQGVAVDASGSIWTANSGSNTVSKFVGLAAPVAVPLSVGP